MTRKITPKGADQFLLERFLPYRLSLLSNTVSEGIAIAYRTEYGLSVTKWRVIAILGRFPGQTASEVVHRTAMDKVAISRAVKKLQDKGLVERQEHEEDRRRQPLALTSALGEPLYRAIIPQALDYEQDLLDALSKTEQQQLDSIIEKLQSAANRLNSG